MVELELPSLETQFFIFSKWGDVNSDGTTITLTQSDKWMKYAKIFETLKLPLTDTGETFFKPMKYRLTFQEYIIFLEDLALKKNIDYFELERLMCVCGDPNVPEVEKKKKF